MAKSKDTPKREAKKPRKEPIRKGQSHGGGRRMEERDGAMSTESQRRYTRG